MAAARKMYPSHRAYYRRLLVDDDPYRFVPEVDISDIERAIAQDGSIEPLPYTTEQPPRGYFPATTERRVV